MAGMKRGSRFLTREEARAIDRAAEEVYHIPSLLLMENAARGATAAALRMLKGARGPVLIFCGGGNNGGDGLAIARHLFLRDVDVRVILMTDPQRYSGDARTNWEIVQAMGIGHEPASTECIKNIRPTLIIDAIFGTGLTQPPREPFPQIAEAINASGVPVLAVDVPSGLDCDTGAAARNTIRAAHTCTFVARKTGFDAPGAAQFTGAVHVLDIGAPRRLVAEVLGG